MTVYIVGRNEQYYEAIMALWNQLFINIKSLIAWQYCLKDVNYINSLTLSMVRRHRGILKMNETWIQMYF